MRAVLALLLLAGCDRVFGLGDPYEDAPRGGGSADALAVDAPPPGDAPIDGPDKRPAPLVHYRFDDTFAEAGGGANASCTTSGGGDCLFVAGKYGGALHFDGSSIGHITLPSLPPSFTLMLWVDSASGPAIDLAQQVAAPTRDVWWLDLGTSIAFQTTSGATQTTVAARPNETWTHIAVTYDGTRQLLYVDAIAQAQTFVGALAYGTNNLVCVGCRMSQATTMYFSGDLDDVYIFDRALTQTEIGFYAGSAH
ncbi:MAG: LamG domain-containing protein [Deltaproteobacteria bacterium]|nr:LamG domain-containing protein [Deltaproteobacteria bacterium]